MTTGDTVLRVIRHAETGAAIDGFYCTALRCSLTTRSCARRHAIAKTQLDHVEVTAVGASTELSEAHICAACPIGEGNLASHPERGGPRGKTRQRVKLLSRDRTKKTGLPVRPGDVIGIYTVMAKNGPMTELRCDRCGHVRWSTHKDRKALEAARCCQKCPAAVKRANGVAWAQPKSITDEVAARIVAMFGEGKSRREISAACNVSPTGVRKQLIRSGLIKGPPGFVTPTPAGA